MLSLRNLRKETNTSHSGIVATSTKGRFNRPLLDSCFRASAGANARGLGFDRLRRISVWMFG